MSSWISDVILITAIPHFHIIDLKVLDDKINTLLGCVCVSMRACVHAGNWYQVKNIVEMGRTQFRQNMLPSDL